MRHYLGEAEYLLGGIIGNVAAHGRVLCENYAAIQCPVLAVGGWADGFTNAVFRLLEHLQVPRRGLIGPWGHTYRR